MTPGAGPFYEMVQQSYIETNHFGAKEILVFEMYADARRTRSSVRSSVRLKFRLKFRSSAHSRLRSSLRSLSRPSSTHGRRIQLPGIMPY